MGKTLILIDGHALAFRQFYALERSNMRTSNGVPTWAVYGFFKAVFDLLNNKVFKFDAIAVAFDISHQTFRTEAYDKYKSNRIEMPDTMRTQMDLIYEGLRAFSIPIYTKEGFEADDVIGTISLKACEHGHKVKILTGDQDAFQLIDKNGCTSVIIPSQGTLCEYDWDKVYEKLGVYPDQIVDYKALRGDDSDCIPGVKGIGSKTAQKLLAHYGTLDSIIENCNNLIDSRAQKNLCEGMESAKLSKYLATIIRDLDVDFDFDKAQVALPDILKVTEFLKKMQFYTFIKNIDEIMYSFNSAEQTKTELPLNGQLGLFSNFVNEEINKKSDFRFSKKIITNMADLEILIDNLKKHKLISFKVYADMKSAVSSQITSFAFAYSSSISADERIICKDNNFDIEAFYIPIRHPGLESELTAEEIISALRPIFESDDIKKTTYSAKSEYNILRNVEIYSKGIIFDVALASYVNDSGQRHELDAQALDYLNHSITFVNSGKKNSETDNSIPVDGFFDSVCGEVSAILKLSAFWVKKLNDKELNIVYNIEVPLETVLADMEYNGVAVDEDYLVELTALMNEKLCKLKSDIYNLAGCSFNINSPKQVGEILYVKMGIKSKKKSGRSKFSTGAAILEELAKDNEIVRLILEYRKYSKLKSTYTGALPALIDCKDHRIHTTYNQIITATGRLSSSNPNLQNIPIKTEDGNKIRKAFVAQDRENGLILSADYSQVELRLLAHVTGDEHLIDVFRQGIDVHTQTASKVFDVPPEKVTREMRSKAKAVNFGIIYGQSKYGLAKSLRIPVADAGDFIDKYFATYPKILPFMEKVIENAHRNGYVETIFGRKRYLIAEFSSTNKLVREFGRRAAINQPIQGSCADLMKLAMIDFSNKLKEHKLKTKMIIQVHDELVLEVYKPELELVTNLVKEAMELNQPLSVPLVVDINSGVTWQEK